MIIFVFFALKVPRLQPDRDMNVNIAEQVSKVSVVGNYTSLTVALKVPMLQPD